MNTSAPSYVGRFAPSPTGALHFGSLLAALASYLDAHHHRGRWLMRMEDLDPPREQPGAAHAILSTLERFGLHWDGEVVYQSQRLEIYQTILNQLLTEGLAYRCDCSRQQISARTDATYDGYCRSHPPSPASTTAVRIGAANRTLTILDRIQGQQQWQLQPGQDDFVLFRRDGYFAYQLAVVIDDAQQGVQQIVRGSDLLDSTPRQRLLQQLLGYPQPSYAHIPVLVNEQGQKLSKQTFAQPIEQRPPVPTLLTALHALGQNPPAELQDASSTELLVWAAQHWRIEQIPQHQQLPASIVEEGH